MKKISTLHVSAPGRICLFGEHQDYLGLPVITSAINRRVSIKGEKWNKNEFYLDLPDIADDETITFQFPQSYDKERDYLKSSYNVFSRHFSPATCGFRCEVHGDIPINSGTSSSSALVVAWLQYLKSSQSGNLKVDAWQIAALAHQAEVLEFDEPGGKMDHVACACGGLLYIDFKKNAPPESLNTTLGAFVLGNSEQPKDTKGLLKRVKVVALEGMNKIQQENPELNFSNLTFQYLDEYAKLLNRNERRVLEGNIVNRGITQDALRNFQSADFNERDFGLYLDFHQKVLREKLKISTRKIDKMVDAALNAGALGAKINGSGGGGCMFAYAPQHAEAVAEAIGKAGGTAYILRPDEGVRIDLAE